MRLKQPYSAKHVNRLAKELGFEKDGFGYSEWEKKVNGKNLTMKPHGGPYGRYVTMAMETDIPHSQPWSGWKWEWTILTLTIK